MSTVNVTDSSLEQVIQNNKLVLLDFWAPWCGPCRIIGPILEQLTDEMGSEVLVAKLNVDDNQLSAAKYRIQGIPTLKLFHNGKEVQTFVGVQPLQTLKSAIKQYVK
ncbi:thioredoxin [Paenibacillus motobuensis]|uniref:thioredoxin n=1 Tax=Paenibacillus TaxID=44249 RepID=UPI00203B9533|nr:MULTISPECIES: thioredoxin [Paenibacillus]MCM3041472.1 thioredoxin [Paenibacillus lutimineralis]MCM3648576.1 thioredoxin [Paenibacillus motobuensis]